MWYLKRPDVPDYYIYLKPFEETTFGRKKGTVCMPDDDSISRLHASIHIKPKNNVKTNEPTSACILKDRGSKYGTYVVKGGQKIEVTEEECLLHDQDIIRFGVQETMFTVTYVPIITVVSSMNNEDKSTLQNVMDHIDGMISTEWTTNCTHLTVSKATLTEKVTWALASAIPIVTSNYWVHVKEAVLKHKELPQPHSFIPPIGESLIDKNKFLLRPNENRKTLFKNLIFMHFSINQYKIYGKMIHLAGGKSLLYSKKPLTCKELCSPNVIVLQYPGDDATQATQQIVPEYNSIYRALQKQGRKMIAESEIPLAILHCSVEKFCNPKFCFAELLKRSEPKPDTSEVLALDTQDVDTNRNSVLELVSIVPLNKKITITTKKIPPRIIPETCNDFSQDIVIIPNDQPLRIAACSSPITCPDESIKTSNIPTANANTMGARNSKASNIYIPETYDSFVSSMMSKDVLSSTQTINNLRTVEVEIPKTSKQSAAVNDKPSIEEIIDLSEDERTSPNMNRAKASPPKELNALSKKSPTKNMKITEDHLISASLSDDITYNNDNNYATDVGDSDDPICRNCDMESQCFGNKKRKLSDSSGSNSSIKEISPECSCSDCAGNESDSNGLVQSFCVSQTNFKKFKKAPVIIPEKRIGLSDMYVWQKFVV